MNTRRRLVTSAALGSALAALAIPARPQVIGKPARIVVGFPAGGSTDVLAKLLADRLRGAYAPSIGIDYKPGASGRLGAEAVKAADGDGSQVLLTPCSILWLYPHVYRRLNYEVQRDFTPVAPVGTVAFALAVGPAVPAHVKTVADYLRWVKADRLNHAAVASPALGATPHFVGVMFGRAAGVALDHVAYHGGAPALDALLAGKVPASINVLSEVLPQLPSGKLRLLATSGTQRSRLTPEVPTFAESGFHEATAAEVFGLFVPSRTPPELSAKLNALLRDIASSKDFSDALAALGCEIANPSSPDFTNTVKAELDRWSTIVNVSGFDRYVPQPQAVTF